MATTTVFSTLTGCVGCVVSIEALSRENKHCMNLMTFATFVFISLHGLVFHAKFFTIRNQIPFRYYCKIVMLFFFVNVANNQALTFGISMPLLIVFRSGSLMANLLLGVVLKHRIYSLRKYVSVCVITLGIIICTMASPAQQNDRPLENTMNQWSFPVSRVLIGVALLSSALLTSAYLGLCQEDIYRNFGNHTQELMLYVHMLSLPAFLLLWPDISAAAQEFNGSHIPKIFGFYLFLPKLWWHLLFTCILQWVCITNVYQLTSQLSSLNVTLVITLRKFVSLILSIWIFDNPFTTVHFLGTVLVFGGTIAFYDHWNVLWLRAGLYGSAKKEA